MTDHEARARDEISGPSTNVFADLDLPYHAKALEIVNTERCRNCRTIGDTCECEAEGGIRIAYPLSGDDLISAISSALKEAVEAAEKRCADVCIRRAQECRSSAQSLKAGDHADQLQAQADFNSAEDLGAAAAEILSAIRSRKEP